MRRYGSAMRTVVLMLFAALCVTTLAAADATRSYELGAGGLVIQAPATWAPVRGQGGAALVLRGPATVDLGAAAERSRPVITVALRAGLTAAEGDVFARQCRDDLAGLLASFVLVSEGTVELGGRRWSVLRYRFAVGHLTWEQVARTTVIEGTGVCVTCSCAADAIARWEVEFDAAIASLGRSRPTLDAR